MGTQAGLTVAMIRKAMRALKKNNVPPRVIQTQREADLFNLQEKILFGKKGRWRIGDHYYRAWMHPMAFGTL